MKLRYTSLGLTVLSFSVIVLSGPGTRAGLFGFRAGLLLFAAALLLAIASLTLAVVALVVPRLRRGQVRPLFLILVVDLALMSGPALLASKARRVPMIHDITTDVDDPPPFVELVAIRRAADAPNPPEYAGPVVAKAQQDAYPDLAPLELDVPPPQVFPRALAAARELGWEIVAERPAEGRIEATATSAWFGFKDDIVVRLVASGTGTRLDVRSKSRVGRSDLGANAARIRAFLEGVRP